ncbi:unnamed protein product [Ixodes hexagonus]
MPEELKNRLAQTGVDMLEESTISCNQGNDIQLAPLSLPGFLVLVVSITSSLFSIYKGSILLRMLKQPVVREEEDRFGIPQRADAFHGTVFLCQGALYCVQIYLLVNYSNRRRKISWMVLLAFVVCSLLLSDFEEPLHSVFFLSSAVLATVCVVLRRTQLKTSAR